MKGDYSLIRIVTLTVAWIPLIYIGLLFISYMSLEGFFSRFNIAAEYWLDDLPEPIRLSLPILKLLFVVATLLLYIIFYVVYLAGNCKSKKLKSNKKEPSNHYQKLYGIGNDKSAPTGKLIIMLILIALITVVEFVTYPPITEATRIPIQAGLSFLVLITITTILSSRERTFLQGHSYANLLRKWFPLSITLLLYLFLGGLLRSLGQFEAQRVQNNKVQVTLSLNNQPVILDSTTYYIRQTNKWIFFYKESVDSILVYPMNNITSIEFRAGLSRGNINKP